MLEAMGGRKFIMAIVIMIAGVVIELKSANGISVSMVGLLTALYATFSASNTLITNKQLKIEASGVSSLPESAGQINQAEPEASSSNIATESVAIDELRQQLIPIVNTIGNELVSLKEGQAAQMQAIGTIQQSASNIQKGISALISIRQ